MRNRPIAFPGVSSQRPCWSLALVVGLLTCSQARAGESLQQRLQRHDELIDAPRVTHSLEWAVDSSDAIVTAVIPRGRKDFRLETVLKPVGQMDVNWPPSDKERLAAIEELYRPGDEVLLFLRFDEAGKSSHIYHYFPLISLDDPRRSIGSDKFYYSLPETMDSTTKMYTARRSTHAGFWHLSVDKEGRTVKDHKDLLRRVKARIAAGSRVPSDCDREAVERTESVYGGFFVYWPLESGLSAAEFPMVLVPAEPEFREYYFRPAERGLRSISPSLENYRDAEVIMKLKETLEDRTVSERAYRVSSKALVRQVTYELPPGKRPPLVDGEAEGKVRVERIFTKRKQSFEMLKRMGVEVEMPDLMP